MTTGKLQAEGFPFRFPAGETQVRIRTTTLQGMDWALKEVVTFKKLVRNGDDVMEILLTADALRRLGHKRLRLVLPYVPYGRQDRVMVPGEALGIKVFADLINSVGFEEVEIWDPHSDVTSALINNVRVVPQETLMLGMSKLRNFPQDCILVCPDAGARKKIMSVAKVLNKTEIVFADKIRDADTGQITGTKLNWQSSTVFHVGKTTPYDYLIVDDLIDGGKTFIEIAKAIRKDMDGYPSNLYLYVTHGFFSKGMDELAEHFQGIYVANMMSQDPKVLEHPIVRSR